MNYENFWLFSYSNQRFVEFPGNINVQFLSILSLNVRFEQKLLSKGSY